MKQLKSKCKVAAVQASPVLFNKEATVEKALTLIARAAGQNADVIIFPEVFIPAYPRGWLSSPSGHCGHRMCSFLPSGSPAF